MSICYWLDMNEQEPCPGAILQEVKGEETLLGIVLTAEKATGELRFKTMLRVLTPNYKIKSYLVSVRPSNL